MRDKKRNKSGSQNNAELPSLVVNKTLSQGIPQLLLSIKNEALNHPITLKVQESLGKFIEKHGVGFIREATLEKL